MNKIECGYCGAAHLDPTLSILSCPVYKENNAAWEKKTEGMSTKEVNDLLASVRSNQI